MKTHFSPSPLHLLSFSAAAATGQCSTAAGCTQRPTFQARERHRGLPGHRERSVCVLWGFVFPLRCGRVGRRYQRGQGPRQGGAGAVEISVLQQNDESQVGCAKCVDTSQIPRATAVQCHTMLPNEISRVCRLLFWVWLRPRLRIVRHSPLTS